MRRTSIRSTVIVLLCMVSLIYYLNIEHIIKHVLRKVSSLDVFRASGQSGPNSPTFNQRDYVLNFNLPIYPPVQCIPIKTIHGKIPICVHNDPTELISWRIRSDQEWEGTISKSVQEILVENPDYGYLDIGANLGMFSLLAANLQRPTLSVEAMDINIEKFHQSIVINHFEKYITLVTRPLSDKRETLHFAAKMDNLGHSWLVENKKDPGSIPKKNVYRTKNKTTLMLDELIDLMPRKKAIMVIDVEGNEGKIIRGGQKFFDAIFISHVFMEWNLLKDNDQKFLVDFFSKRGYEPYGSPSFKTTLDWSDYILWPTNVFWKNKQYMGKNN